jgi:hypothetical protein
MQTPKIKMVSLCPLEKQSGKESVKSTLFGAISVRQLYECALIMAIYYGYTDAKWPDVQQLHGVLVLKEYPAMKFPVFCANCRFITVLTRALPWCLP